MLLRRAGLDIGDGERDDDDDDDDDDEEDDEETVCRFVFLRASASLRRREGGDGVREILRFLE